MLARIKAILLVIEFVITVLITIVLMYIFRNSTHVIRRTWAKMQTFIMSFSIKQTGSANLEAKLLILNHQSLVDIIALEAIYPKNLCWVAKKEIGDIPLFGHILRAPKMISIDRKDKRSIIKIIKQSKIRIAEGRVIAMFPEGTRSDGKKLLKFQDGSKILAEKLNLKVQPVIVVNTRKILDSQNLKAKGGDISVIYLDIIDAKEDENWYVHVQEKMQKALDDELANNPSYR